MDDNVMRILQLLQDGKITAPEAEMLIAALRGETSADGASSEKKEDDGERSILLGFEKLRAPKLDLDNLGERISKAVSRVQPEKIVKRVQTQLRTATQASAHWSASFTQRVRSWADGDGTRPASPGGIPELVDTVDHELHLDANAAVVVENPLGNVRISAVEDGAATVKIRKHVWSSRQEDLKPLLDSIEIEVHGTDSRLDVKVRASEPFAEGTADIEIKLPRTAGIRVATHFGDIDVAGLHGRTEAVATTGKLSLHDLGGDVRAETASGDLTIDCIEGSAIVATQSGDIRANQLRRGLTANSASGDVTATDVEGGRVECKSVSGDVSVERVGILAPLDVIVESVSGDARLTEATGNIALKAVSGDIEAIALDATRLQAQTVSGDVTARLRAPFSGTMQVNTVSGDVALDLPEGSNIRVTLSTSAGDLRCEHDALDVDAAPTLWTGQIGTGAGTLNVQTISGDSTIRRA